jgi:hypothetical protein
MRFYRFVIMGPLALAADASAQGTTVADTAATVRFSGYAEVYYAFDLARPADNERPEFLYNHKRHNEVTANLLLVHAEYERDGVRGAVGLMGGTYAQYNLAHEPVMMRQVYEARVGVRLAKRRELWLDAGIFPSHIGFETVIGLDNHTLTRSIVAENSPYYEAGAMLSYHPNDRFMLAALVLNGWQRIQRPVGQTRPAFGTQVKFDDAGGTVLNWSTFMGWVGPDGMDIWRVYNNLYGSLNSDSFGATLGVDFGVQRAAPAIGPTAEGVQGWFTVVGIFRQRFASRWWGIGRIEYFGDDGVVIGGRSIAGVSLGSDLRINERAAWRLEARGFGSAAETFRLHDGTPSQVNLAFTTALCLKL